LKTKISTIEAETISEEETSLKSWIKLQTENFPRLFRILKFCIVGSSGAVVNMFFLWFFTDIFNLYYLLSSLLAIEISIINNFAWNYLWTWTDRKEQHLKGILIHFFKYHLTMIFAAMGNFILLIFFKEILGIHYLIANLLGMICVSVINYIVIDRWAFKKGTKNKFENKEF